MQIKNLFFLLIFIVSCSEDNDVTIPRNLQEYIEANSGRELDNVIACAASASGSAILSYIYYYPIENATEISYYEAKSTILDENDFSNYRREILPVNSVFGGKLKRFSRSKEEEAWCIVTFLTDGKLHVSDPIRLKNASKPTEYNSDVTIEYPGTLEPKFTWTDGAIEENVIYFHIITDDENEDGEEEFVSGTYTTEKTFQFYDISNVVLDINEGVTPVLTADNQYNFAMLGLSEDNWVNVFIKKTFTPRNLQEYLDVNSTKTLADALAFGASVNNSTTLSYIYYYPLIGATNIRYYETEKIAVDETDFSNYRKKELVATSVFGGKLSRLSRADSQESWAIVTYIIEEKFYKSAPIKIQNQTKPTEWLSEVEITYPETLMPIFTWVDGSRPENAIYFQVFENPDDTFLSGTFTTEKTFQYYNITPNGTSTINLETPSALVLDSEYDFSLIGISEDNWVNLYIQRTFIAE